jgi:hypothetical protein
MKQEHKNWIVMALLAIALLSVGMFIGYLTSIIAKA